MASGVTAGRPDMTMIDVEALGWDSNTVGELDHRLLKAPSIKLRSAQRGANGDVVYCVDLRIRRPNAEQCLTVTELHSLEHFLLEGLKRSLSENFVSVGIMGCRTGYYLTFLNEGRAMTILGVLEEILTGILSATAVPYARIDQCGNYIDHSLTLAQRIAGEVLQAKSTWLDAV